MESWEADEKQRDEVHQKKEDACNSAKVRRKKIHLEKSRNAETLCLSNDSCVGWVEQ